MANQLATLPWVIDTAAAGAIATGYLKITQFEWIEYTADAHEVVVKDKNGNLVWHGNGADDLQPVSSGFVGSIQGLIVDQLDSGKLIVWIE